mgnify:FL=1
MKITYLDRHVNVQTDRFGRAVVTSSTTAVLFLYTFSPGQAMTEHTQPLSHVFLTVLEGEGHITVDRETVIAGEGAVITVEPGIVHAIHNRSDKPLVVSSFMSPKP